MILKEKKFSLFLKMLLNAFVCKKNTDNEIIYVVKPNSKCLRDLMYEVHKNFDYAFPNDLLYEIVYDIISEAVHSDISSKIELEDLDLSSLIPVYNSDLEKFIKLNTFNCYFEENPPEKGVNFYSYLSNYAYNTYEEIKFIIIQYLEELEFVD